MKLNGFGETIRRIEAERLAEAHAAVAAGWTETDHPAKCCPAGPTTKGRARTHEQKAERARSLAVNAENRASDARIKLLRLKLTDSQPSDRAQANIPWTRARTARVDRLIDTAVERVRLTEAIHHNEARAKHWRGQERKWS